MKIKEIGNKITITGEVQCNSCKGTGLYQGMGERDGAFVVCWDCNGTGKENVRIEYIKFKGRVLRSKCKRVYSNGMGYCITDKDIVSSQGIKFPFSEFGCSYKDWQNGVNPIPLKFLGCPYQETNQALQSKDVNNLYKLRCKNNLGFSDIRHCKLYSDKETCWSIFEGKGK